MTDFVSNSISSFAQKSTHLVITEKYVEKLVEAEENYLKILELFADPVSHIEKEKSNDDCDNNPVAAFMESILKEGSSETGEITTDYVTDTSICKMIEIFETMIPDGKGKITADGAKESFLELIQKQQNNPCSCNRLSIKIPDPDIDENSVPVTMFFDTMFCGTCGWSGDQHVACSHYIPGEESEEGEDCATCNLSIYSHKACSAFDPGEGVEQFDTCANCSRRIHDHELGSHCSNPRKHPGGQNRCANCFNQIDSHFYTEQRKRLSQKASDELTILSFKISIELFNKNIHPLTKLTIQDYSILINNLIYTDIRALALVMEN